MFDNNSGTSANNIVKFVESLSGVFKADVSDDGWLILIMDNGQTFSFYADLINSYVVSHKSANTISVGVPIDYDYATNDVNGDGIDDYVVVHPDGIVQLMLTKIH